MMVWVLFFDDVAVSHYQNWEDLKRDIYHLKKNLGDRCPYLTHELKTIGFY
jgi:hypothetical protein